MIFKFILQAFPFIRGNLSILFYFMEAVVNGTISLISLGAYLSLVYKKATELCG